VCAHRLKDAIEETAVAEVVQTRRERSRGRCNSVRRCSGHLRMAIFTAAHCEGKLQSHERGRKCARAIRYWPGRTKQTHGSGFRIGNPFASSSNSGYSPNREIYGVHVKKTCDVVVRRQACVVCRVGGVWCCGLGCMTPTHKAGGGAEEVKYVGASTRLSLAREQPGSGVSLGPGVLSTPRLYHYTP
jgi:hypothetical protein